MIVPCLLVFAATGGGHAFAACSGTVPFFVYGTCADDAPRQVAAAARRPRFLLTPRRSGKWVENIERDGRTTGYYVSTRSDGARAAGKALSDPVRLTIRCRKDNTSVFFSFAGREMGDKGAQREFVYAIDDGEEKILELERGSDHAILGVWQGYRAVPLLRRLVSARSLKISALAADGTELRASFSLDGLERGIERLRSACRW